MQGWHCTTISSSSCNALPPVSFRNTGVSSSCSAAGHRAQLVDGAAGDDLSLQNDADAIAHLLRHFERVRAHENRDAVLAHPPEHALDELRAARIESDHRLVHEHGLRPMQERRAHDEPLLHAVREALDQLVLPAAELEQVEHLAHALVQAVAVHAVEAGVKAQKFSRGQLFVDVGPVGNEAERRLRGFRMRREIVAVDDDAPGRRLQQAGNHPDRRGLSRAVRSEKAVNLSGIHVEIDAVDGRERAVLFPQILNGNH